MRESFDIAFARAVADVAALAELTLPFARVGGLAVLHKKANISNELDRAQGAINTLGGELRHVMPITFAGALTGALAGLNGNALVVIEKRRATPVRYPRRPGMPAKRPLT